jgi:hypothetical protein
MSGVLWNLINNNLFIQVYNQTFFFNINTISGYIMYQLCKSEEYDKIKEKLIWNKLGEL